MGTERKHYEQWFAKCRGPRHPADEAAALIAADASDQMQASGKYSEASVDKLVDAASSPRGLVWNCGADLLCAAVRRWPQTSAAIANMLKSRHAKIRLRAISCITNAMPRPTKIQRITDGLVDKSGTVRAQSPVSDGISSKFVDKKDLTPRGIAKVVSELKKED